MKYLSVLIGMLLALDANVALASSTASSITLSPLSPQTLGVLRGTPGCEQPAAVDGSPYWEIPTIAQMQGAGGVSQVKIDIDAAGNLVNATLYASSGDRWLDDAALRSARLTHFSPEVNGCRKVSGTYLYIVQF